MEFTDEFKDGVKKFMKEADIESDKFLDLTLEAVRNSVEVAKSEELEKYASEKDLGDLDKFIIKAAQDDEPVPGEGEGISEKALLRTLLGLGLGGFGGYLKPYLMGAEPAEDWTRYIPVATGGLMGGLAGSTLGGEQSLLSQILRQQAT